MKVKVAFVTFVIVALLALPSLVACAKPNPVVEQATSEELHLPDPVIERVTSLGWDGTCDPADKTLLDEICGLPQHLQVNEAVLSHVSAITADGTVKPEELNAFQDLDGDTIPNLVEVFLGIDPLKSDSDNDGANDQEDEDVSLILDWKIGCCEDEGICTCQLISMHLHPHPHMDVIEVPKPEWPIPCPLGIYCQQKPINEKEWKDELIRWPDLNPEKKRTEIIRFLPRCHISLGENRQSWVDFQSVAAQAPTGLESARIRCLEQYIISQATSRLFTVTVYKLVR